MKRLPEILEARLPSVALVEALSEMPDYEEWATNLDMVYAPRGTVFLCKLFGIDTEVLRRAIYQECFARVSNLERTTNAD